MDRRKFLMNAAGMAVACHCPSAVGSPQPPHGHLPTAVQQRFFPAPTRSIVPVVADGKWIWNEPPRDQTGYLEPRDFEVVVGISLRGNGDARRLMATTVVPDRHPEQVPTAPEIVAAGCRAAVRSVTGEVAQLVLVAESLRNRQTISATATYRVTLRKQYFGFQADQFPQRQQIPARLTSTLAQHSPGIETGDAAVRKIVRELAGEHPWFQAQKYYEWVWNEIRPQVGQFTSVSTAIKRRAGDCEERAAVFVAFCRAAGIPARLVWVPNHNWAEFALVSHDGLVRWIPVHTAAYSWFGWTGAHELVLQKGDRIKLPELPHPQRLVADWMTWQGRRPEVTFTASMKPLATSPSTDPGPGARQKQPGGEWQIVDDHPASRYMRR